MNPLLKKALAEFLGVAVFLTAITAGVGPFKVVALALALGLMIMVTGPVSGGHLNPAVSLFFYSRRAITLGDLLAYIAAQLAGGAFGAYLGSVLAGGTLKGFTAFGQSLPTNYIVGEVVATAGLVWLIGTLVQHAKPEAIPYSVTAWIIAAATFTVTGAQANPAVTFGLMLNGLAPNQGAVLILAELVGLMAAVLLLIVFAPAAKKATAKKAASKKK